MAKDLAMVIGAGALGRLVGKAGKKVESGADAVPLYALPQYALLAIAAESIFIIPATDAAGIKKKLPHHEIPLSDITSVVVDERRATTGFEISLCSGQLLKGETKRLAANRYNTSVLRRLKELVQA